LAIALIVAVVFYPSLRLSVAAVGVDDGMPPSWHNALEWLRRDTPDPFGDPAIYLARYDQGPLPTASYTVMNWWDYGYWIVRAGRRVPVANPTQEGAVEAARFLSATTEREAAAVLAASRARYVIIDRALSFSLASDASTLRGKFNGVLEWAGRRRTDYFEVMMSRAADGRLAPTFVFYPEYYRAMAVRLSRFGAGPVEPADSTWVISVEERQGASGSRVLEIVNSTRFASYAAAAAYRNRLGPGPYRLVGLDPNKSCVPLSEVSTLGLVHEESDASGNDVRVFAVTPH
jgi:hypothetical protein